MERKNLTNQDFLLSHNDLLNEKVVMLSLLSASRYH